MIEVFNLINYKYDVVRDDINDLIVYELKFYKSLNQLNVWF